VASIIKIKRSDVSGSIPSNLETGEIAVNLFDRKLYVGNTASGVSTIGGEDFRLTTQDSTGGVLLKMIGESVLSTNTILIQEGSDLDIVRQANGTITIGVKDSIVANTTGNAATATQLQTARNITLTGGVTGTASFDGTADASIAAIVPDNSHAHVISNVTGLRTELDTKSTWDALTSTNTAIRTLVSDRMQVANTNALIDTKLNANAGISFTGDVTGSGSFSSHDATIALDLSEDVSTSRLVVNNYIQLSTSTDLPAHGEGRIFYDNSNKALAVYNEESDVTLQVGQEEWIRVYNNTGSVIGNGKAVYLSGETTGTPTIALADASNADRIEVVGLTTHEIENASYGYVTARGTVSGLNTSMLDAGERAYLSFTDPGELQNVSPDYPNYPVDIGIVLVEDAANGIIYVDVKTHTEESSRTTGNSRVDGNLTVGGNLTVIGNEAITNFTNLQVADTFVYLNGGDSIANTEYTGSSLNDMTFKGHYSGSGEKTFYVKIDNNSTPDTFSWSTDNFSTTEAANVAITGTEQELEDGISVLFEATTGHTVGDVWTGTGSPANVDTGWASNRNAGTYTHLGIFWDSSANRFEAFKSYSPDVSGNIDTGDSSYAKGDFSANTFYGDLVGGVSGDVIGNASTATALATARSISLSGDVTGIVDFDGTSDVNIGVTVADDSHNHIIANVDGLQTELNTKSTWAALTSTNTAIRTLVSDRMQVANTNALVNDRMQVANTVLLVNDRMQVANVNTLVDDRMQVANTISLANARLGATASVTLNGQVAGSGSFSSNTLTITTTLNQDIPLGTSTTGNYVSTVAGTPNQIVVTGSGTETANVTLALSDDVSVVGQLNVGENIVATGNTTVGGSLSVNGDATIDGNLTVEGALTYIATSTVYADDSMFKLSANNAGDVVDSGIYAKYVVSANSAVKYAGYFRDATDGAFKFYSGIDTEPTTTVDTSDTGYGLAQVDAIIDGGTY